MQPSEITKILASGKSQKGVYEPTPQDVKDLYAFFAEKYGTRYTNKADNALMKFISVFVGLGSSTPEDFIQKFVTTIGKVIYLPYEIGVPGEDGMWSLWAQIITCVHEHQHVVQYNHVDTKGGLDFQQQYLLKKRRRTRFETEAYTTSLELHYWRYGQVRNSDSLVVPLAAYWVGDLDLQVAKQTFELNNKMIGKGAIITEASSVAIKWFEERGIHSKG